MLSGINSEPSLLECQETSPLQEPSNAGLFKHKAYACTIFFLYSFFFYLLFQKSLRRTISVLEIELGEMCFSAESAGFA